MRKKTSIRTQSSSVWSDHRHDDGDCEVLGGPLCRSVVQLWARGRALEPVAAVERPTQKSVAASFDCVAHGTFSIRRHLVNRGDKERHSCATCCRQGDLDGYQYPTDHSYHLGCFRRRRLLRARPLVVIIAASVVRVALLRTRGQR
jgi:hypothetical protein